MGEIVDAEERTGELHQVTKKKQTNKKNQKKNAISCLLLIRSIISFVIRVLLHDLNSKKLGLTLRNTFLNMQPFSCPTDSEEEQGVRTSLLEETAQIRYNILCHNIEIIWEFC